MKQVSVLVGAGSIGQAIIRRVSAGKHIVLADYSEENAQRAAKTLENAGHWRMRALSVQPYDATLARKRTS